MIMTLTLVVRNEPQPFPTGKLTHKTVRLLTPAGNSGVVYLATSEVGCSTPGQRLAIAAGSSLPLRLTQLAELCFAGTANDELGVFCEVEDDSK